MEIWPGTAYPWAPPTTGPAPISRCSPKSPDRVQLCLFDDSGTETRIDLTEVDGFIWHCFLPAVGPG